MDQVRLLWVDATRGIAIVLVALFHAILFTEALELPVGPWGAIGQVLAVFRMPVFFVVSGLLVAGWLQRSWSEMVRSKLVLWIWVYLVWSVISYVVFAFVPWIRPRWAPVGNDVLADLVKIVLWPDSGLWYLYALTVYLVLIRLTRSWPAVLVVGGAAVIAYLFGTGAYNTGNWVFDYIGRHLVFFALGARMSGLVRTVASARSRSIGWAFVGYACLALATVLVARGLDRPVVHLIVTPQLRPLTGALAVVAGVLFAVLVSRGGFAGPLAYLGSRTLPIYVAHEILIACIAAALVLIRSELPAWSGLVLPVLLTATVIPMTLGLHRIFGRIAGLYEPPVLLRSRRSRHPSPTMAAQDLGTPPARRAPSRS